MNERKDGEEFPVQLSSVVVRNRQKEFLGLATICEDITECKKNEEKIHQLAYYDSLTGLPNRALFLDRLQKALAVADRSNHSVAVLFLDLDLKHFPVDRIKIDRAFIAGIDLDAGDTAIVAAVIALCRTLKLKVLAEGVETRAQLDFLQGNGCSEIQGYFLGAPMPAADLAQWMKMAPEQAVPLRLAGY